MWKIDNLRRWETGLGLLLVTTMITTPALAGTQPSADGQGHHARISADVHAEPEAELTPEEKRALAVAASRLLGHVDKARQAITAEKKDEALNEANLGLTLVQIIENTVPEYEVEATIKSGDIEYMDTDRVKDLLVPIFDELGQVSVLRPIKDAKMATSKGVQLADPRVVTNVEEEETAVWLDIATAKTYLKTAEIALADNRLEAADLDLAALQAGGVTLVVNEVDRPLVKARENLALAKDKITHEHPQEAKAALQEAVVALKAYEEVAGTPQAEKAKILYEAISALTQKVESEQNGAAKKIDQWWDQLAHWNET